MDNVVTMSLEEYTKLVVENTNLKMQLSNLKKKSIDRAFDEIKDSTIDRLSTIEDCQKALSLSLDSVLSNYASSYSWTWRGIAGDSYGLFTEQEIKELVAGEIKKRINEKCKELIEEEKEVNENVDSESR